MEISGFAFAVLSPTVPASKGKAQSPVEHTTKGAKISRDMCQGNPKKSSSVEIHTLEKACVVQLAQQNTEIIPHPHRENLRQGS